MEERNQLFRGVMCTLLGGICWGFSGSCGQFLFDHYHVDPTWLTTVRMLCAGLVMVAYVLLRQRERVTACWRNQRDAVKLAAFGVFGMLFS